jgi:HK97 family phage major capsid protein
MDSAYDIESYITAKTAESMALTLGTAFVNGNGSTKPTGIYDATNGLQAGRKTTTATATAITYNDIINLIYSLKTRYAQNAMFFMNRKVKGYIQGIVDGVSGQPIFRESAIVGEPATLLGYPVVEVEDMDSAITAGKNTILFGDMASAYRIVLHTDTGMLRDDVTKKGFVQFYTYMRVGGKLVQPEALVGLIQHA